MKWGYKKDKQTCVKTGRFLNGDQMNLWKKKNVTMSSSGMIIMMMTMKMKMIMMTTQKDEQENHDINQDAIQIEYNTENATDDAREEDNNVEPEECEEYTPTGNQEQDPIDETTIEDETSDDDKSIETRSAQDHDEHNDHTNETGDMNDDSNDRDTPSEGVNVGGHNLRGNRN